MVKPGTQDAFARENALLRQRNAHLEASLAAIHDGETDAVILAGYGGNRLLTLDSADRAYRLLVEEMGEGAITLTPTGVITYANRRFAEMLGRPLQQVLGSRIAGCIAPEGRQAVLELLKDGPLSRHNAEVDLLTGAGHRVSALLSARRLVIDGMPDAVCMVVTDLTVQKLGEVEIQTRETLLKVVEAHERTEGRLHASLATLRLVIDGLGPDMFLGLMTPQGVLIQASRPALAAAAVSAEDVLGKPFDETYWWSHSEAARQQLRAAMTRAAAGEPSRYEVQVRGVGESLVWLDFSLHPVRDAQGQVIYLVPSGNVIDDRKAFERTLRQASVKAEAASLAKSDFLASMSHEIRTPISVVIGLSYLLSKTSMAQEQIEIVDKIKLASKSLLMVINNVLDLSKIEAGELIVERVGFYLGEHLKDLADVASILADAKGIAFAMNASTDLPQALEGDPAHLNQVLSNLLSNAVKFTVKGGVTLKVRQLAQTPEHVTLSFTVKDTGIGIAPEEQAGLFEPFAQADASINRRFGGTGLGLSIVKRLTSLMGGEVSLASASGAGCEFNVVLNFPRASPQALAVLEASPARPADDALNGVRVLVVDDSDINLDVTKRILEVAGASVWLASGGQEALNFLQAQAGVDIVLMDVQMPVLNGHETARLIRLIPNLASLPIIAVSAGALSSEQQKAVVAGMDGYIVKPFEAYTLVSSILERIRREGRRSAATWVPPSTSQTRESKEAWPQIQGIDTADVRERLSDDVGLFQKMLKRLLGEFTGAGSPAEPNTLAALPLHAARMHKLKGSAGMLGAKVIQELARQAEVACSVGAMDRAAALTSGIATHLRQLQESVASTIMPSPFSGVEAQQAGWDLEPQVLADLIEALARQDRAATRRFGALSPQFRRLLREAVAAARTLHMLKAQKADVRGELATLREKLLSLRQQFAEIPATYLVEANEQLVIAAMNANTRADAAMTDLAELARNSERDGLTDTPNRTLMLERIERSIEIAKRRQTKVAVLFVDLDGFKEINDLQGHAAGDVALCSAARRMESVVRDADTVSRHGGDEFVVLLGAISDGCNAAFIA